MKLAELQQAVRAADPATVLVTPTVLHRVIQQECKLPALLLEVPHRKSFVVDRHILFRHVEQEELDLEPDRLLPATVILLAQPAPEHLTAQKRDALFLEYWRLLFHAKIHQTLEDQCHAGTLNLDIVRERIEQIGRTEFEEVRLVLGQDRYLLPPATDLTVYIEFAATFLELRFFAANLLPIYFPGIVDLEKIAELLNRDLDSADLFTRTRLAGAPDPVVRTDKRSDESNDYYWRLIRQAERAGRAGNTVRAAIVRTRAARVAPASLAFSTRVGAEEELQHLMARLQAALHLSDTEVREWLKDLPPLLEKADQGSRPVEATLLFDLQKVCLDHERDIYSLDLIEWLLSGGKRPIKRPLPGQRLVRIAKHLKNAAQRLTMARLADAERQHLAKLLQTALQGSEERLRDRLRPVLNDALQDVGLSPRTPPERTAFFKIIEEILDRISETGFLTFSDLRDILSRNQLKFPDVADPQEFVRGDQLLRLDRRLSTLLDGVYRRSEAYLRWMERLTSLSFGTETGRRICKMVVFPFGGALALLEGAQYLMDEFGWKGAIFGPLSSFLPVEEDRPRLPSLGFLLLAILGVFFLGLLHVEPLRRGCLRLGRGLIRGLRTVAIDFPTWLVRSPLVRQVAQTWVFQLFLWYILKPAVVCVVLWRLLPPDYRTWFGAAVIFVAANSLLNSRLGKGVSEALVQTVINLYDLLRAGLLPGIVRLVAALFKRILDGLEYVLFMVDEWLRFRSGDSRFSMIVRMILGVAWFPISYVVRFYTVVLIEPGFNPIKAPLSLLFAKVTTIYTAPLAFSLRNQLAISPVSILIFMIAFMTLWLVPDAFTFLFWEMKENWKLYRANRRPLLRPVPVGPRGEPVRQLLQPGFHSGTIPKLYSRLRQTEREALETGNWRAARLCLQGLEQVEKSLQRLVSREILTLLRQSPEWRGQAVQVGQVALASNRIRVELTHEHFPASPVRLTIEAQSGWLVAGVADPGWLTRLDADQARMAVVALAGLYKLAGIDLVREQIQANLPPGVAGYDLTRTHLILWLDHRFGQALYYDLGSLNGQLKPRTPKGRIAAEGPVFESTQLVFGRVPLPWDLWVESWRQDQIGKTPTNLFNADVKLLPAASERSANLLTADEPPTAV